ncbi:MAG: TetR/AcrR family transcriptional regulator [Candidatus Electrothrix sp. AR4]|nr:TetR/AcrR family transcriptional regulator [Candidatus Electrothrix sp. AR4]
MFTEKTRLSIQEKNMSRIDDSKAETRRLILNAAHILFWKKGADKCTIRDISEEAGVSPASVIVHFKNKTALLEAALYQEIEKALGKALATLPGKANLQATLIHLLAFMLTFYDNNRELYRILVRDTFFEPIHNSPSMGKLDKQYLTFIISLIDQEKEQGGIREEVNASLLASSFFHLYLGVLRDFLRDPELTVTTAVDQLSVTLELYFTGIAQTGEKQ